MTTRSCPAPVYFYRPEATFLFKEQRVAPELHIHSKRLQPPAWHDGGENWEERKVKAQGL